MRSAESEIAITIFHSAPPHFRIQSINIGYLYVNIGSKKPYYGVANPSYKKNDCLVCVGMSPSRFDELYNDNGAFWNLCLRKDNQY